MCVVVVSVEIHIVPIERFVSFGVLGSDCSVAHGYQLVMHELHADPNVFDDLRIGILFFFACSPDIDARTGNVGEVFEDLIDLIVDVLFGNRPAGAKSIQETLAPLCQRRRAALERLIVVRQKGLEGHFVPAQCAQGIREQELESIVRRSFGSGFTVDCDKLVEPALVRIVGRRAQGTAQTSMSLGGNNLRSRRLEYAGDLVKGHLHHVQLMLALQLVDKDGHLPKASRASRRVRVIARGLTLRSGRLHNRPAFFALFSLPSGKRTTMTPATPTNADQELQLFEARIDELVTLVTQLREENRALRQRLDGLMTERATLLQKNEQVRARVEAMIGRLKAMEHGA